VKLRTPRLSVSDEEFEAELTAFAVLVGSAAAASRFARTAARNGNRPSSLMAGFGAEPSRALRLDKASCGECAPQPFVRTGRNCMRACRYPPALSMTLSYSILKSTYFPRLGEAGDRSVRTHPTERSGAWAIQARK
jgi:hypothetical protein